ncbi:MAG: AAA family ATPase, partial [Deltaproteobacteria bacterium]|nr:AAA family ATPase [Deltaproteobacteria bacterium]
MKILELRFKNLNSLYGEWSIDLTAPEYLADGIFAITGPTGSGKSTILDAICLALYGTTPRLGKITKSGNEIMSRQTGECYAEVTFAASAGKFRCHWSQHRAHKKATGNLADAKHEIADATSGKILESKKRDVAAVIEKKTGMNFERFTRSILLAQGGFDTFLKADSDRRAPILEQITGSEIYSEISIRVHERQRDEREQLNLLQAETSGITLLTKEQEAETNLELTEKQITATKTATQIQEIEKALAWHTGIDKLRQEIISLAQEAEKLNTTLEIFIPQREKLDRAQKAAELEGAYANLVSTRKQQEDDQTAIQKEETQLPQATDSVAQKEALLKDSENLTLAAKNRQKSITPLLQKVRTLDQQLADRKKTISKEEIEAKKIEQKITADQKLQEQIKSKFSTTQKDAKIIENYLQSNTGDKSLVTQLAGIEEQFNNLISKQLNISAGEVSLIEAEKQLKSAIKKFSRHSRKAASHTQELNDAQRQVGNKKTSLNTLLEKHLLREYRTEKETRLREMAFFKKIADLNSAR